MVRTLLDRRDAAAGDDHDAPPLRVLALHPQLEVDLRLEDGVEDLLAERIDLAIRLSPVHHLDAVVRRVTNTSLVCTGSHHYFER